MSRVPDLPCAVCGKIMWRGTTSLPEGQAKCLPCRRASSTRRREPLPLVAKECIYCGANFESSRPRRIYCSKKCGREAVRKPPAPVRDCTGCGSTLGDYRSTYCPSCSQRSRHGWQGGKELVLWHPTATKHPRVQALVHTMSRRVFKARSCVICSAQFITTGNGITCSERCEHANTRDIRSNHRHKRRERIKSTQREPVRRVAIFIRDKWTCQLCGEPIEQDLTWPHKMYPSLDHIVPLSNGGGHSMDNCQATHFLCNVRKSDRLQTPATHPKVAPTALSRAAQGSSLSAFLVGVPD